MKADSVQAREVTMISASDVLAFTMELTAVAALSTWGWRAAGWPGALLAVIAFTAVWGTFLSPRAALPITGVWWPAAQFAVFTGAAAALSGTAGPVPAAAFLALALLSVILGGTR